MTKANQKKPAAGAKTQQTGGSHLLEFEKVSFDDGASKPKATDEELNSRYVKGENRIVTEQARYPLAGILEMLREEIEGEGGTKELRYKLDPEYQRRHRWSDERKSRLIESFLMNVPVPPVFLYESELARFEVMDGRQRLTALSEISTPTSSRSPDCSTGRTSTAGSIRSFRKRSETALIAATSRR